MVTLMIGACSACGVMRAASARDDIGASIARGVRVVDVAGRARPRNGRVVSALIDGEAIAGDAGVASLAVRSGARTGLTCRGGRVTIGEISGGRGASTLGDGLAGRSFGEVDTGC
jgi:hypothetical protein